MRTYPAVTTNIDKREGYKPIVGTNLDYAVKAAMCDGKGAAWTEDEQVAARSRMGIVSMTQEEYDTITPSDNTLYIITEADT